MPSAIVYYLGVTVLITVLLAGSAHLAIVSVVTEKKEYQLSFLMGLPINPLDYTLSKILGGLAIYLVCWTTVVGATLVIFSTSHLPNGMIPMLIICATEILAATAILLCVSVLSGSEAVPIVTMVLLNLFFNLFLFWVANIPAIGGNLSADTAVFNQTSMTIIAAELAIMLLVIFITTYFKSRKACFL